MSFLDMLYLAGVAAFQHRYVEGKLVNKYGTTTRKIKYFRDSLNLFLLSLLHQKNLS